jgi:hypothetical protein
MHRLPLGVVLTSLSDETDFGGINRHLFGDFFQKGFFPFFVLDAAESFPGASG